VLEVEWGGGETGTLRALSYVSTDGGAHWRLVPGKTDIHVVDQVGGATFALLVDTTTLDDPSQHAILVVSHDALRTWRSITPPDLAAYGQVFRFWAQPTTGQLLAATLGAALGPTLWRSEDGGAHWARVPTAKSQIDQALWLPRVQRWLLCAQALCSEDLGATWSTLSTVRCPVQGLTIDGALITVCPDSLREISRHLIGSTSVTSLGTTPWPLSYLAPTGEMWSVVGQQASVTVLPLDAS
jgi:hypothetical protein